MAELLSPAGSMAALDAAIAGGADAVYLGLRRGGARAFAENFDTDGLEAASGKLHLRGKKLYLTLNILATDRTVRELAELAASVWDAGYCDAFIVQDLGLARLIKELRPDSVLHASTQACIHSAAGAVAARSLGFDRVVIARECGRDEIEKCAKTGIETEVFIHGAVCVSQSGGCLMSSFIGKRSGNRGECAQPCRLAYGNGYPLSLKDMCLAPHIPELMDMGVCSFKIEGRMKSPEYVYGVTDIYRRLIDGHRAASADEMSRLAALFSRGGFSDGYYTGNTGAGMFGIRSEHDKELSRSAPPPAPLPDIPVNMHGSFSLSGSSLTASAGGVTVTVAGASPLPATGKGTDSEELVSRLSRTGESGFAAEEVTVTSENGIFVRASEVNSLRRAALSSLSAALLEKNRPAGSGLIPDYGKGAEVWKGKTVLRFAHAPRTDSGFEYADRIDLPLWEIDSLPYAAEHASRISAVLPRTVFGSEEERVSEMLERVREIGVNHATVPGIGMLRLCRGMILHGDYTLNITNSLSAATADANGFSSICVSPESFPGAVKTRLTREYIVYGAQPLMHTENCIVRNINRGCGKGCSALLTDRTGASFPVMREYGHRSIIYNSVPTVLTDLDTGADAEILFFTTEKDPLPVIKAYLTHRAPEGAFTRGWFVKDKGRKRSR